MCAVNILYVGYPHSVPMRRAMAYGPYNIEYRYLRMSYEKTVMSGTRATLTYDNTVVPLVGWYS